jgi:hypothetical protein
MYLSPAGTSCVSRAERVVYNHAAFHQTWTPRALFESDERDVKASTSRTREKSATISSIMFEVTKSSSFQKASPRAVTSATSLDEQPMSSSMAMVTISRGFPTCGATTRL